MRTPELMERENEGVVSCSCCAGKVGPMVNFGEYAGYVCKGCVDKAAFYLAAELMARE